MASFRWQAELAPVPRPWLVEALAELVRRQDVEPDDEVTLVRWGPARRTLVAGDADSRFTVDLRGDDLRGELRVEAPDVDATADLGSWWERTEGRRRKAAAPVRVEVRHRLARVHVHVDVHPADAGRWLVEVRARGHGRRWVRPLAAVALLLAGPTLRRRLRTKLDEFPPEWNRRVAQLVAEPPANAVADLLDEHRAPRDHHPPRARTRAEVPPAPRRRRRRPLWSAVVAATAVGLGIGVGVLTKPDRDRRPTATSLVVPPSAVVPEVGDCFSRSVPVSCGRPHDVEVLRMVLVAQEAPDGAALDRCRDAGVDAPPPSVLSVWRFGSAAFCVALGPDGG